MQPTRLEVETAIQSVRLAQGAVSVGDLQLTAILLDTALKLLIEGDGE